MERIVGIGHSAIFAVALAAVFGVTLLARSAREPLPAAAATPAMYVQSPSAIQSMALAYDAVVADIYWVRAVQHYGRTRRSPDTDPSYALLFPLLDITTTLDPHFTIAYRLGAVFLAEPYPNGPGRPDLAVALLEKGLGAEPSRWQYMQDLGFIYYWWLHDHAEAAAWFLRASEVPDAPWWLRSLAATTLVQGGDRDASRMLWREIHGSMDHPWIRSDAERRLLQLDALDGIDRLQRLVSSWGASIDAAPSNWDSLIAAGRLAAVPLDPVGVPYALHADGRVSLGEGSPLQPLPTEPWAADPFLP